MILLFPMLNFEQPIYGTVSYTVKFTFFFAAYTASVTHAILFHYHHMWMGLKCLFSTKYRLKQQNDVHNRLMRRYPEAPLWWYATVFVIAFVLGVGALAKFLPEAPIWVRISTQLDLTVSSLSLHRGFLLV